MNDTNQDEINLRHALTQSDRAVYEKLRTNLIAKHGYEQFREIQRQAFAVICSNCCA